MATFEHLVLLLINLDLVFEISKKIMFDQKGSII